MYAAFRSIGAYAPEKILTNDELTKMVDTTDEWIKTRTGVERRHVVEPDQTTSDMCVEAAKKAIEAAGVSIVSVHSHCGVPVQSIAKSSVRSGR